MMSTRHIFSQRSFNRAALAAALLAVIVTAGCGESGERTVPDGLVPLSGKVLLNDKPADEVAINFIPDRGSETQSGFAVTDADGNFKARHISQMGDTDPATWGLEPGSYQVTFSRIRMPDGSKLPADLEEKGQTAMDVDARETLPRHLTQIASEMPANMVRVPFEGDELVFKLKMKE